MWRTGWPLENLPNYYYSAWLQRIRKNRNFKKFLAAGCSFFKCFHSNNFALILISRDIPFKEIVNLWVDLHWRKLLLNLCFSSRVFEQCKGMSTTEQRIYLLISSWNCIMYMCYRSVIYVPPKNNLIYIHYTAVCAWVIGIEKVQQES